MLYAYLRRVEGEKLTAYQDTNGTWTIGVGHTGRKVVKGRTITLTESTRLLARDVARTAKRVTALVRVPLTGPQWASLVSLAFNIGTRAFRHSTVLRRVNAQDFKNVPDAFRMWIKETINGHKVVNEGLVNRRELDIELWETIPSPQ